MVSGAVWLPLAVAVCIVLYVFARDGGLLIQLLVIATSIVVLLSILGCAPYDPGGCGVEPIARALEARSTGERVEVKGTQLSLAAVKLASGRGVCVAPDAWIGIHEVRLSRSCDYARGVRDEMRTAFYAALMPRCVRGLFASRHAFDSGKLVVFTGREILAACPTIRACGS